MTSDSWDEVTELCLALRADMPQLAPQITERIRRELPAYAAVPRQEHRRFVAEGQVALLDALAARRPPTLKDLQQASRLGVARADEGVPIETVIGAYHIGNRELWRLLTRQPLGNQTLLPVIAEMMWDNIQITTSAVSTAHAERTRMRHTNEITVQYRLLELVVAGDVGNEARVLAETLGLAPDGQFVAACVSTVDTASDRLDRVQAGLDRSPGIVYHTRYDDTVVALSQGTPSARLAREVRAADPHARLGVGIRRRGLSGAHESVTDARRALVLAHADTPVRYFEECWLQACLVAERDRLSPLIESVAEVARAQPHLVEAVVAFAEAGFVVSGAARALPVHPNTVTYRLERWAQLSGCDPHSLTGLVQSLLAAWLTDPRQVSLR